MHRGPFPKHYLNLNHLSSKFFRVILLGKKISMQKREFVEAPAFRVALFTPFPVAEQLLAFPFVFVIVS